MSDETIQVPDDMSDEDLLFAIHQRLLDRFGQREDLSTRQAAAVDRAIEAVDDAAVEFLGG